MPAHDNITAQLRRLDADLAPAKLLRVLQQRSVLPVGETRERPVDVRVVSASHKDLAQIVRDGRFHEDLYYPLARFELTLPPLRERGRDVVLIARELLSRGADGVPARSLARGAEAVLVAYDWRGNVRELENGAVPGGAPRACSQRDRGRPVRGAPGQGGGRTNRAAGGARARDGRRRG